MYMIEQNIARVTHKTVMWNVVALDFELWEVIFWWFDIEVLF